MNLSDRINPEQEAHFLYMLAQRIAASPARFVFLLENHNMTYPRKLLLDQQASSVLERAGFTDYFSEMEQRHRELTLMMGLQLLENGQLEEEINKDETKRIQLHLSGDQVTSIKETCDAVRKKLGRNKLLMERLLIDPAARRYKDAPGVKLFIMSLVMVNPGSVQSVMHNDPFNKLDSVRSEIVGAGGPDQFERLLSQEVQEFLEQFARYRDFGQTDKNTAKRILDIAKKTKGRGLIPIGSLHGAFANSPHCLPDQLLSQGMARGLDAASELIMLADTKSVKLIHSQVIKSGRELRPSVVVYDVEKQQEWPILEWVAKIPAIYGERIYSAASPAPE